MRRIAIGFLLLASAAAAGERLSLAFTDGAERVLEVSSFDEEGLTVLRGGSPQRIPWAALTPESALAARRSFIDYDDGPGRLALSEFAARLGLFERSFEELDIALALGAVDEAAYEQRAGALREAEVKALTSRIHELLASDAPPEATLAAIKRLKERYPEHEANARYDAEVKRLVALLAERVEAEQQAEEQAVRDARLAELQAGIDRLTAIKDRALAKAAKLVEDTARAIELRQVSRVKRQLLEPGGAEKYYKDAREALREMARVDRKFELVSREDLQKEYDVIADRLVQCYLEVARIQLHERNYKSAAEYVRKILYYDPIQEEALEMIEEIRRNRISFRASDITNARPRVTGG